MLAGVEGVAAVLLVCGVLGLVAGTVAPPAGVGVETGAFFAGMGFKLAFNLFWKLVSRLLFNCVVFLVKSSLDHTCEVDGLAAAAVFGGTLGWLPEPKKLGAVFCASATHTKLLKISARPVAIDCLIELNIRFTPSWVHHRLCLDLI